MLGPSLFSSSSYTFSSSSSSSSSSLARVVLITLVIVNITLTSVRALATSEPPFFYDCEDEGFFPHPKDCRKYFWCLDSGPANLGIVPHAFTCPSGLYFNTKTEACDYPANVPCANQPKSSSTRTRKVLKKRPTSNSTTTTTPDPLNESDEIFITTANSDVTTTEVPTTLAPIVSRAPSRFRRPSSTPSTARTTSTTTTTTTTSTTTTTPAPVTASENDNLKQLLHLVESLGGVDKIKSLVDEKSVSGNSLSHNHHDDSLHEDTGRSPSSTSNVRVNSRPVASTPSPAFFSPSYETPNRPEFSRLVSSSLVTESTAIVSNSPSNQVPRHRRPQQQQSNQVTSDPVTVAPVTVNPFFSYADPSRTPGLTDTIGEQDFSSVNTSPLLPSRDTVTRSEGVNNNGNFFSFSYNTPGGRVSASQGPIVTRTADQSNRNNVTPSAASSLLPPSSPFVDFFSYNTPGRLPQSSTRADTFVTEATIFLDEENNQDQVNNNNNNNGRSNNNNNFDTLSVRQPNVPNVVSNRNRLEQPLNNARVRSSSTTGAARTGDRLNGSNNGGNFVRIRVSNTLPNGQVTSLNSPDSIRLSTGLTQGQPNTPNTSTGRRATRVRINSNVNSFNNQVSPAVASSFTGNSFANAPTSAAAAAASGSSFLPPSAPLPHESNTFTRPNQPGVLYDEDHEHVNIPGESPIDTFIGTRKPSSQSLRRRPPQRAHLRNRPEENPVGNFVNLPPPNLQVDPIVDPTVVTGDNIHHNNGLPRPFPPKPSNPPPTRMPSGPLRQPGGQIFDNTNPSNAPRVLPHNVPLVTLPPWASSVTSNPLSLATTSAESPVTPSSLNDASYRPGTVQYSSLNINQRPPQPSLDDLFYTDLPFFDMNGKDEASEHNNNKEFNNNPSVDHLSSFSPVSSAPIAPVTVPVTLPTTTATTTTSTTTTTTTVSPITSGLLVTNDTPVTDTRSSVNPTFSRGSDSLRTNSRQRDRSRSRANAQTAQSQVADQSPRSPPIVTASPQVRQRRPQQQQPQQQQQQVTTPVTPAAVSSSGSSLNEPTGPPVAMMDSGNIKCTRRGVFIHPASCGQFVVCAPASRGSTSYRSYVHHCPAEQVFVEEVGRCRPGNKERCEVFTK